MKRPRTVIVLFAAAVGGFMIAFTGAVEGQIEGQIGATEAPAGFDLVSNGFAEEFCANQDALVNSPNSPKIPDVDDPSTPVNEDECEFEAALEEFTGPESIADGLGPIFNAAGCGECHVVPIIGGTSQINEKRAGFFDGLTFIEHPGGSLIQDRALHPSIQELALPEHTNVTTQRSTLSVLGDGFVEAISNSTLQAIADSQPLSMRGELVSVEVLEKPGANSTGRFGHKAQHASLVSFSADAYKNEMGITSPLAPDEPTSNGNSIAAFDTAPAGNPTAPDDEGVDVELFALFMRSTLVPPRDLRRTRTTVAGSNIFNNIGCTVCHTPRITTSAPGTAINGGALKVARALGNKVIRPFGDFLLHDIDTGDGIVQNGPASTRNKVRTAALWGLRARGRLMRDALSFNITDAIERHGNQAASARDAFEALSSSDKQKLIDFLLSL